MTPPTWMTDAQADAWRRGVERAERDARATHAATDQRIAHGDVVSYVAPAFLTVDYDPTHRGRVR